MKKYAFFAFKGEVMCFNHVLINALEMKAKGDEALIILEGEAVSLVETLEKSGHPVFKEAKDSGMIDCICKACSIKMGALEYNQKCGIPLCDELNGHPSMLRYMKKGYDIITL